MAEIVSKAALKLDAPVVSAQPIPSGKEGKPAVPVVAESKSEGRTWSWGQVGQAAKYAGIGIGAATVLYYGASPLWETAQRVPEFARTVHTVVTKGIPIVVKTVNEAVDNTIGVHQALGHGVALLRQGMNWAGVSTPPVPTDPADIAKVGGELAAKGIAWGIMVFLLNPVWGPLSAVSKPLFKGREAPFSGALLTWFVVETAAPGLTSNATTALAQVSEKAKNLTSAALNQTKEAFQNDSVKTTFFATTAATVTVLALSLFKALRARFSQAAPVPVAPAAPVAAPAAAAPQIVISAAAARVLVDGLRALMVRNRIRVGR